MNGKQDLIERSVRQNDGILALHPAWVARDFIPPGRRLGLAESEYDVGERGYICERWLASVTTADNAVGPDDEGLSRLNLRSDQQVTLKEATEILPELLLGKDYAATHKGLGRLVKLYDFGSRIPFHFHQMSKDATLLGRNSKDEAYYFLEDVDLGPHPETFFGVHPSLVERKEYDLLLPYLVDWNSDGILKHSRAYVNVPGEGFFLPSGILHAPGTALTLELQEDSDVGSFVQALNAGEIISKELLYKDVLPDLRRSRGERAVLDQLDWEANGDPYFYENHHLSPIPVGNANADSAKEWWVFYNTPKFSGKKIELEAGEALTTSENGAFSLFLWRGEADVDGHSVCSDKPGNDELFVCYDRATRPLEIKNTGDSRVVLFKFFGPDINPDAPKIEGYPTSPHTTTRSGE